MKDLDFERDVLGAHIWLGAHNSLEGFTPQPATPLSRPLCRATSAKKSFYFFYCCKRLEWPFYLYTNYGPLRGFLRRRPLPNPPP